jgi:site-specific DNA-cytosine methylase
MEFLLGQLAKFGYTCKWKVLNTMEFGLPQHRPRWYLIAIRNDVLRVRPLGIPWFPSAFPSMVPLASLLTPLPTDKWEAAPTAEPGRGNVLEAYRLRVAHGVNPFLVPVVVDVGASARFRLHGVNACPRITKSQAGHFGYWFSTKGGRPTAEELAMLHGFNPAAINWKPAGVSETKSGAASATRRA